MDIQVQHATEFNGIPSDAQLIFWSIDTLDYCEIRGNLCIRIASTEEIQQLNLDYRHKDNPTNVLAFPFEAPDCIENDYLGDIVICPDVVFEEAKAQDKDFHAHFAHMVIHGTLHLMGFDHDTDSHAQEMEAIEIKVLRAHGIPNPYEDTA